VHEVPPAVRPQKLYKSILGCRVVTVAVR